MDMQQKYSMDTQQRHAAWTWSMKAWIYSVNMQHEDMDMQHGHEA
jgi:hypothetical protein